MDFEVNHHLACESALHRLLLLLLPPSIPALNPSLTCRS
jgi:hypothetical protein